MLYRQGMVHIYGLYHDIQLIGGTLAEFWGPDAMVVLASASYFSLTFWIQGPPFAGAPRVYDRQIHGRHQNGCH
jgi:hypothetical protein